MSIDPRYIEWGKQHSDGCTGIPDWFIGACYLHDYLVRHGCDINGNPVTPAEAHRQLRLAIQHDSKFGVWSPVSWWRWTGAWFFYLVWFKWVGYG